MTDLRILLFSFKNMVALSYWSLGRLDRTTLIKLGQKGVQMQFINSDGSKKIKTLEFQDEKRADNFFVLLNSTSKYLQERL